MKYVDGDLIGLALMEEVDVIVHGCNCFNTMGAGIAKSIKQHFPEAYKADCQTQRGNKKKLGTITFAQCGDVTVVNAYTQFDYSNRGTNADYNAIRKAFKLIKEQFSGKRIGLPLIGCGLAGGDWNTVEKIIQEELEGEEVTVVRFRG